MGRAKASSLEFKNNQIPLGQLYTPEIESFAYGRNEGKLFLYSILPPCMGNDQMSPALSARLSP